jgi:hypothetical protein
MNANDAQVIQAFVAMGVGGLTLVGLFLTARQVVIGSRQQRDNLAAQRELRQPYVFVDVKHEPLGGRWICTAVNTGPTVATDVSIQFEPPLPGRRDETGLSVWLIASLSPGAKRTYLIDFVTMADATFKDASPATVTVTGNGPDGSLPELTYVIDLKAVHDSLAERDPAKEIVDAIKALKKGF